MRSVRKEIGGLGNLLFKEAFIYGQLLDGNLPDLYLQSEKYWAKHKDKIRQRFSSGIGTDDRVALHIRRGDYLKASQFHANLTDTQYYIQAVELFPEDRFLVFCKDNQGIIQDSEDQFWCSEYLESIIPGRFDLQPFDSTEVEDMNAMASCSSLIGANSSFSWWAAELGNHKSVIFPSENKWFTDGIVRCELPERYTKL